MIQRWIAFWNDQDSLRYRRSVPIVLMIGGVLAIFVGLFTLLANNAGASIPLEPQTLKQSVGLGLIMVVYGLFWFNDLETRSRLNWLMAHANLTAERIHLLRRITNADGQADDRAPTADRWPWGSHHTEMLGHVEAAARKWWANYDPTSPDTAPTNDMVAQWLFDDRGVSRDKAKAIASILRADGLKTGPRR